MVITIKKERIQSFYAMIVVEKKKVGAQMNGIIFFDIDGTLLDGFIGLDKPLDSTIEAMKKAKQNGYYCVIASARSALPVSLDESLFDGFIFSNGNYVEWQGKMLYNNYFSQEQLAYLFELFAKYDAPYMLNGEKKSFHSNKGHTLITQHQEVYGTKEEKVEENYTREDINMITALFHSEDDQNLCKAALPQDWIVHTYNKPNIHMDIHLPGYSKGEAVEFLYKEIGLPFEQTFAFGDGQNDIEMLQAVKHGIAMGNAIEAIKMIALDVTDDVDKDGITKALKKYDVI